MVVKPHALSFNKLYKHAHCIAIIILLYVRMIHRIRSVAVVSCGDVRVIRAQSSGAPLEGVYRSLL